MPALPDKLRELSPSLQVERPRPSDVLQVDAFRNDSELEEVYLITDEGTVDVQLEIRSDPTASGTNVWTGGAKTADSGGDTYTDMNNVDLAAGEYLFAVLTNVVNCGELHVKPKLRIK